jgi:hypothetical protein
MAFNGSGTYNLPAGNPVVTGTTISSSTSNTTNSDIATALTNCITRDGQSTPSANLPMNAKKLTGLAAGTSAGDSVRYEQVVLTGGALGTPTSGTLTSCTGLPLTTGITGTLPVGNGGTGLTSPSTTGNVLTSNGTAWVSSAPAGATGGLTWLSTVTASGASTADIETTFNSTYDSYLLVADSIHTASDGQAIYMQMKLGGSYDTGANYFYQVENTDSSTTNGQYDSNNYSGIDHILVTQYTGSTAGYASNFRMQIYNPASTTYRKLVSFEGNTQVTNTRLRKGNGAGGNSATTALTGLRFYPSSGTFSGTFRLYGFSKS